MNRTDIKSDLLVSFRVIRRRYGRHPFCDCSCCRFEAVTAFPAPKSELSRKEKKVTLNQILNLLMTKYFLLNKVSVK